MIHNEAVSDKFIFIGIENFRWCTETISNCVILAGELQKSVQTKTEEPNHGQSKKIDYSLSFSSKKLSDDFFLNWHSNYSSGRDHFTKDISDGGAPLAS